MHTLQIIGRNDKGTGINLCQSCQCASKKSEGSTSLCQFLPTSLIYLIITRGRREGVGVMLHGGITFRNGKTTNRKFPEDKISLFAFMHPGVGALFFNDKVIEV